MGQTFTACTGGERTSGHFSLVFVDVTGMLVTPIKLQYLHSPSVLVSWSVLFRQEQGWIHELHVLDSCKKMAQITHDCFSLITERRRTAVRTLLLSSFLMTFAMTERFWIPLCHGNCLYSDQTFFLRSVWPTRVVFIGERVLVTKLFSWMSTLPQCWRNQSDWCNYTIMVAWSVLTWMRIRTDLQARCPWQSQANGPCWSPTL